MKRFFAMAAFAVFAAAPAMAGDAYHLWGSGVGAGCDGPCASAELNGRLTLGGFSGGVGAGATNRAYVVGGYDRRYWPYYGQEDIAFRRARDAAFTWGGPKSDRGFRFWAHSIQSRRTAR